MGRKITISDHERFWQRVVVRGPDECWPYTGGITGRGYGAFMVGSRTDGTRKQIPAHRFAYEDTIGPIPDGHEVDHECHNEDETCNAGEACLHRRCCNPAHHVAKSERDNTLAGRTPAALNAAKEFCPKGHEYTPENTGPSRRGSRGGRPGRRCRQCNREYMQDRTRRRREAMAA